MNSILYSKTSCVIILNILELSSLIPEKKSYRRKQCIDMEEQFLRETLQIHISYLYCKKVKQLFMLVQIWFIL